MDLRPLPAGCTAWRFWCRCWSPPVPPARHHRSNRRLSSRLPQRQRQRRRHRRGHGGAGFAVDDVLFFLQTQHAVLHEAINHRDEGERAGLARLHHHVADAALAHRRYAHTQRPVHLHAGTSEHPPRVGDGRQEAAALRVAVGVQRGLRRTRQKVEPVPRQRQRVAVHEGRVRLVKHGLRRLRLHPGHRIAHLFRATDPGREVGVHKRFRCWLQKVCGLARDYTLPPVWR